jgi:hypothetical protein
MSEKAKTLSQLGVGILTPNLPVKRAKYSGHPEVGSPSRHILFKRANPLEIGTPLNCKNGRKVEVRFVVTEVTPVFFT